MLNKTREDQKPIEQSQMADDSPQDAEAANRGGNTTYKDSKRALGTTPPRVIKQLTVVDTTAGTT